MPVGVRRVGALVAVGVLSAVATATATAGVPDGREYELVSPVVKNGNGAGGQVYAGGFSVARGDGNAIFYRTDGPVSDDAPQGIQIAAVSRRGPDGWSTQSALPRAARVDTIAAYVDQLLPAADLSSLVFSASGSYAPPAPATPQTPGLFQTTFGGSASWLSQPQAADADNGPFAAQLGNYAFLPSGGSPDLRTVYFMFTGTLVPGEAPRVPIEQGLGFGGTAGGFYRIQDGALEAAGVLPDGSLDPYGAVPANINNPTGLASWGPDAFHNQVSQDGSRAFFVSPDPASGSGRPSQLYVRIDGRRTELVSRSAIDGSPAATGAVPMTIGPGPNGSPGAGTNPEDGLNHAYVFANRSGRYAFFQSAAQLTTDAPADGSIKSYRFDVDAGTTTYLPGVDGAIVGVADDGEHALFLNLDVSAIKMWTPSGVRTVGTLPNPLPSSPTGPSGLTQAKFSPDGSVVFTTNLSPVGFNDGAFLQVYRYDNAADRLSCLSCPADGDTPIGGALMGPNTLLGTQNGMSAVIEGDAVASHQTSDDGHRVFFDTYAKLVPQDNNGKRDVYEWTDGKVQLLSTGRSPNNSVLLDNSASGDDVFFATTESIDARDTDQAYDVYDARVGGGFAREVDAAPCTTNCQTAGAPVPPPPTVATVTFSGAGNLQPADRPAALARVSVRSRSVKGSRAKITLKAPGKGRLTVSGTHVARVTRSAARAGTYTLNLALTKSARKSLRRHHRLSVRLRIAFTAAESDSSVTTLSLTFKA